ncbi:shikimate/quinate 5-dehydrogenase [Brucella neotomae]|nr:shikimate/quinate 5-dehydrogenase [Brucella neotomae]SPU71288.1 shikimate/quinate 5-dehydrogenase [Brucella neotomae]
MFVSQGTPAGHDIIVNGTSLGLKEGDALPVDPQYLRPEMLAEIIMSPEVTPLLQIAKDSGCSIHPGKAMLDGQLAEMFDFFTR